VREARSCKWSSMGQSHYTASGILGEGPTWCVDIEISQHDGSQVDRKYIIPKRNGKKNNVFKMRKA
jgi:hypothetical protein